MSRKSGYRFSEKDMRRRKNLERIPVRSREHFNTSWFVDKSSSNAAAVTSPR